MKYLSVLIFALFTSSCCGAKQAIESAESKKEITEVNVTEVDTETLTENEEVVEVVSENETNIITETTTENVTEAEAEELIVENTNNGSQHTEIKDSFDHSLWNTLLRKHVSLAGAVNYKAVKNENTQLQAYIASLIENTPSENTGRTETLAYWINAYNALTVDLILRNYPLVSIKDIKDPWDQRLWKFGDKWLNLNDIEHKILRKMNEPRIHFAIVCASVSCPKLQNKAFTADGLEEQLTHATKEFLSDSSKNQLSENSIKLSKIFKWFGKDFKSKNSTIIDFLNAYVDFKISDSAKKSYLDYNWDLNE